MIDQSFAKVDKNKVIAAARRAMENFENEKKATRQKAILDIQKPYKSWFRIRERTSEQAERYIRDFEDKYNKTQEDGEARLTFNETLWVNTWMCSWDYPEELIELANSADEDYIYLCTKDANFVQKWS